MKKEPLPGRGGGKAVGADHGHKMHTARLPGQLFFKENSKWRTKIHMLKTIFKKTDSSVSGEEGPSDPLRVAAEAGPRLSTPFGFN